MGRLTRAKAFSRAAPSSWSSTCTRTSSESTILVTALKRSISPARWCRAPTTELSSSTRSSTPRSLAFISSPAARCPVRSAARTSISSRCGGAHASELRERLAEATTPSRRFRILERALLARLHRPFKRHVAVPVALVRIARGERIGAVAADLGLSHRRLIELFTAEVGMAPKLFGRVQRFQQAIQAAQTARAPDWAGLALAFGYSDQAHLVRDVVAFSGLAPTVISRRGRVPVKANHVAVPMP